MIGRILSGIVAVAYLVSAYFAGGNQTLIRVALFLLLPMACIWYSEEMGSFTGVMRWQSVTATSPGCLVAFCGWILLLLPSVVGLVQFLGGNH